MTRPEPRWSALDWFPIIAFVVTMIAAVVLR